MNDISFRFHQTIQYCCMKHFSLLFTPALMVLSFLSAIAQNEQPASQKPYSLFNPVPKSEMRDFSIDRPDVTESPISVDAGHFQFEGDLYKLTTFDGGNITNIFSGLYKMGLNKNWDIHFGIELYNIYEEELDGGNKVKKGYGNTTIRLKRNLWGNDGNSRTALGMIPYVTLPTSPLDHDAIYGIGFPFSYTLTETLGAGAQFQFDFLPNENGDYKMSYLQTVVLGGVLIGNLDFYVEGMGIFYQGSSIYTANGGLIYNVSDNVKIDVATNLGLTDDSPTRVYVGLSFRL
jgi:Putative MetA-pathway of phenol degradation